MSLSFLQDLNRPSVVAGTGLAALGSLPFVEQWAAESSLLTVKLWNIGFYGLSMWALAQPGRIGDPPSRETKKTKDEKDDDVKEDLRGCGKYQVKSLVTPSAWAFLIWGPILLGELVFVASSTVRLEPTSPMVPLFKKISANFVVAHIFQTLWTACFRPKYCQKGRERQIFLSAGMLTGVAVSLSRAHAHIATAAANWVWPLTLHFGWTIVASFVNWNGALVAQQPPSWAVVEAGKFSAHFLTSVATDVTMRRRAPLLGGTLAWALAACATGTHERIAATYRQKKPADHTWLSGACEQRLVFAIGAVLSASASLYVVVTGSTRRTS